MIKLRIERFRLGMSQQTLGELSGIQQSEISRIESKKTLASPLIRRRIADALNWKNDPKELFKEVNLNEVLR